MTRVCGDPGTATYNLPAELLLECLRAADPATRVRASHVSRTWRQIALSDRRLWDSFACPKFSDERHQEAMFEQLQTMLLRSHPLPFRLHIPHSYCGGTAAEYHSRLTAIIHLDVRRLSLYSGPAYIFSRLNSHEIPLPALTSLNVLDPGAFGSPWTSVFLDGELSSRILPNLRTLRAHSMSFSSDSPPFLALTDLTCSADDAFDYERLFTLCPNLISARFNALDLSMRLPPLTLPRSLHTIELRPEQGFTFGVPELLDKWTIIRLPQLVMHDVDSLQGVLSLFLAVHPRRHIELRLHSRDHALTLSTVPDGGAAVCAWTITPSPMCAEFLGSLDARGCVQLTSLSVSLAQLGRFFIAQLHCPGLEHLEFRLNGKQDWPPLQADDDDFFLRVPRLQRVVFSADAGHADLNEIHCVLGVLRASFRALVVYDAELLESITLSGPAASIQAMDCADLARFAKAYTVCETA